ncbi:MAG: OmpH family outer membrane protein [Muribaculaceae bacterium]|nr:OmpH family outer membrane protein [Muribaculaceae bacterium]
MKKVILAAGAVLALMAAGCSDLAKTAAPVKAVAGDSATTACNIRYIDVDSVLSAYTLAQELTAEQQKEMLAFESAARQKDTELQRLNANIQNKYQNNGYLTEESLKADMNSLQQRQNEANNWANTHQNRIARLVADQQQRLNDSLQNFLKAYNAVYNYDAILDKKVGFFKPELDITAEVIQGLNDRYTPAKKDEEKKK